MNSSKKDATSTWKRSVIEWTVIGSVAALLYFTGLHTEVIGTMQRAMLWTGLFDADTSELATTDGPMLNSRDYGFEMATSDGKTVSLQDFKGDVIFVNLWASWCPPCVAEMPTIETLQKRLEGYKDIHLVLLSLDEKKQKAVEFMEGKEFSLPYYFPASPLPNKFRSQYLPTTYVISKSGKIVYKQEGIADYSSMNFAQWMKELSEK